MREGFKRILAVSLLLLLLALAPLVAARLSVPWWVGLCLLVFLAGIGVALFLVHSIMARRYEAKFVHKELEENGVPQEPPATEEEQLDALQEKWRDAVEKLQGSPLKKLGDPIYALPWYLALGGSGSGKSSALRSSGLSSPFFADPSPPSEGMNCDFWFFDKSVVIETAGRYAFPHEEEDREEWETFISLLGKTRRKEPLNGVIVVVPADRLLSGDSVTIRGEARSLRQRLDELMRVFKVKFPVYVLVSKCDLIDGMERYSALLPDVAVARPMGRVNERCSEDAAAFTDSTVEALLQKLRLYRLRLLSRPQSKELAASLALFPEEFALLKGPLSEFMGALFQDTPYQETPLLRALFFGSGVQKGYPLSFLSSTIQPACELRELPGTERGLFLQEIFSSVIPRDRSLLSPTRSGVQWRMVTANLGFMSWALVMIALCGLLGFSFIKNLRVIRQASVQLAAPPAGGGVSDLDALERYRSAILRVEAQNGTWLTPRLGLSESLRVERGLKEKFCRRFKAAILVPLDKELVQNVSLLHAESPDAAYCQYAMHLVRRLNVLRARLGGARYQELQNDPFPAAPVPAEMSRSLQQQAKNFGRLYLCYLAWSEDVSSLRSEAHSVHSRLQEVLALKGDNLRWLCYWVEHHEGLAPLTLGLFWGGIPSGEPEPVLYPTYTRKGMARLNSLVREVEVATGVKGRFAAAKADLESWQRSAAFAAWHSFAMEFPRGIKRLRGNSEWQRVAAVIGTERGPYLALMNKMAWELEPLSHGAGVPAWLRQLYLLQGARTQRAAQYDGMVAKAAETGARVLGGIKQRLAGTAVASGEALQTTAPAWREYLGALSAIAPAAASRANSFQLASQTFSDDPATGRSPFYAAYHALNRIRLGVALDTPVADVTSRLVTGPMDFLWFYVRKEAAAKLQEQWEEEVVPGAAELPSAQATQVLLGPDGLAWKFAKGPAAPFLVRTPGGFRAKEVLGSTLPIDGAFFSYMARGTQVVASTLTRQANYTVGIRGYPTEANADATTHPHGTRLDLLCTGSTQTLVNLNYPTGKTFNWAPESCFDVVLHVEVGDLVLTRRYGGPGGFPAFLRDFGGGSRTFAASEFPGEAGALARMGIRQVKVNYRFTGSAPVIRQAAAAQAQVPRSIGKP